MISELSITNFKSIKHIKLALNEINLLIGANGAGKSNFISFFKLLRSMRMGRLNTYVAEHGYMDNLLFFGEKEEEKIYGQITFSDKDWRPTNRYEFELLSMQRNRAFISFECSKYYNANGEWDENYHQIDEEHSFVLGESDNYRDRYLKDYFDELFIYHFHDTSANAPLKKTARLNDNLFLREDGGNLPAFLYFLQQKHPKSLRRIERVVASIAPFFEGFSLRPDRLNGEFIQLEWREKGFDRYQNAHNLSDGTLRFIALTTLLLQPEPPRTILIDEPELGLHPFAIAKLAGLIKKVSAKSQVILSTQSISFVNNFDPRDLITVDRRRQESIFQRLDEQRLASWLEDYSLGDLWNKSVIGGQP